MGGKRREGKGGSVPKTGARDERNTEVFERTKMCKFHILGMCLRGTGCKYAHNISELQMPPDLYRTKMCTTMISHGSCNDPECRYAHTKEELRGTPISTKKIEGNESQSGLSAASTCSDVETLKDPIKVPLDRLSMGNVSSNSLCESGMWDSSTEADTTRNYSAWGDFTPQSVKGLSWPYMDQVDEAEDGGDKCEESFWNESSFEGGETMPYYDPEADWVHGLGAVGYPTGTGFGSRMPWWWDSFSGFDSSSTLPPLQGFDAPRLQSNLNLAKLMHDPTEPARVQVTQI